MVLGCCFGQVDKWKPCTSATSLQPKQRSSTTRSAKLDQTYEGPYQVVDQSATGTYRVRHPDGTIPRRSYPLELLKVVPLNRTNADEQLSVLTVDKILDHKTVHGQQHYLTKWKGSPRYKATWEPASNFIEDRPIRLYWKDKKQA